MSSTKPPASRRASSSTGVRPRRALICARASLCSNAREARGGENLLAPVGAILSVADGDEVTPGQDLARVSDGRRAKSQRDITGGLPQFAELFEARRPKDHAIIAKATAALSSAKTKNKRRLRVVPEDESLRAIEYDPEGRGTFRLRRRLREEGDYPLDGNPAPQDILSFSASKRSRITSLRNSEGLSSPQGVPINDKYIVR